MYHGKDKGHYSNDCQVLTDQFHRMRNTRRGQHPKARKDYTSKKEIAAMLGKVTEQVFAKMTAVKKRTVRKDPAEDQMLAIFENVLISNKSKASDDISLSTKCSTDNTNLACSNS